MKLHLPASLFRSVLAALCVATFTCSHTALAANQHADVSLITYTDFGQNKGRYATGNTNALLKHLNAGGVTISYEGGQADYTLEHGMVDFSGVAYNDKGGAGAIGYNFIASATHVPTINPTFTNTSIGQDNAINYKGIEYDSGTVFLHHDGNDYKITRLNKVITDVSGASVYSGSVDSSLEGQLIYRAGTGSMYKADHAGNLTELAPGYVTGGIDAIGNVKELSSTEGSFSTQTFMQYGSDGINESEPLPFMGRPGDSGSPTYIWNEQTGQYEYLNAASSAGSNMTQNRGNTAWTTATMNSYNQVANFGENNNTIYLGAINNPGETLTDGSVSTTIYSGNATNEAGEILATYRGVQSGTHTWKKLNLYKDDANWYIQDTFNASHTAGGTGAAQFDLSYADLFNNDNLVIKNSSTSTQTVTLNATVDLGIGYVQFSRGEGLASADYVVQSAEGAGYLLNSAGFVVDKDVSVHMQLTNPADYIREWRKVGEGDLYIEGNGNNDIFLNVGGSGTTYLKRTDEYGLNWDNYYAAYNVLVNNGATIVINDAEQIKRDLTFGNGGGVLDLNGNSMTWNNSNGAEATGFTIHALDEQAIITNSKAGDPIKGGASELTWTQSGEQTWLGSFTDESNSTLKFIYDGGEGSRLMMHSIHTHLTGDSGMEVKSGTLVLAGTNTVHGTGSVNGVDLTRYTNADDWHYADATTNVTVNSGGTFELGSHARLTGTVTVNEGGTFIMREGVKHQMEYIEGGQKLENTDDIREFFGHKGNVNLAADTATMKVQFSAGTDSTLVYEKRILGSGSVSVEAGTDGGVLRLTGDNSLHTGSKAVVSGGVYASADKALGNTSTNKWLIEEKGWLASDSFTTADTITEHLDARSTGVLALTTDIADEISLAGHEGLIIGAMEGCEVEYGTADKSLAAVDGKWTLGGGGGKLIVNFLLTGDHELVLGNQYGKGSVHLTNTGNNIGTIVFAGGVTLSYEEGALGDVGVDLSYGSNLDMTTASHLTLVSHKAEGALLVDNFATTDMDLTEYQGLSLSSQGDSRYSGNITLAEGAAYRFGGSTGAFTVATELEAGHDLVIDGQDWTGGSVVLEKASAVDGDVTVRGYDAARATEAVGSVTLQLTETNGLAKAASITVDNGGTVELDGSAQSFNKLTLGSGGSLQDSSADRSGTLHLTGETVLNGTLDVAHVTKTGEGNVTLGGTNNATRFEVQGTGDNVVTLTSATATHSQGTLAVSNATLDFNKQAAQGTVELGDDTTLSNMSSVNKLHVKGSNNTVSSHTGSFNIANLTTEAGSSLTLEAGQATMGLATISSLSGAGDVTLNLKGPSSLNTSLAAVSINGTNSNYTGHLSIQSTGGNKSTVSFNSFASFGSGVVTLDGVYLKIGNSRTDNVDATLDIGAGGLEISGDYQGTSFKGLSGSGQVVTSAAITFREDLRGFSGTLQSGTGSDKAISFGGATANYHSITGDTSTGAINLFSSANSTKLLGYTGSAAYNRAYQFQYADDVILNATVSNKASITQAGTGRLVINQANTATGTLTINEGGTVELAEGGSWAGSLAGSGTLVNSNAAATLGDTSSFTGSLSLAEGSSLSMGSSYSLNSGESLGVFAVEGVATGATLNLGTLTLNGGSLSFSAGALVDAQSAALSTNATISAGSALAGQTITLSDTSKLSAGSYLLASGDWASLSNTTFTVNGVADYLTSSVTASSSGLLLTIAQADGIQLWNGTSGHSSWTAETFGTADAGSGNAYFSDAAESKKVSISGAVSADALVFNATEDYVLTPASGSTLSAGSLELKDSGKVTLNSGITISGTTTLAEGSEVVVKDFNTLRGAVSGAGTVTIDAGTGDAIIGPTGTSNAKLLIGDNLGTLKISSGRVQFFTVPSIDKVTVEDGGQLYLGTAKTFDYDIELSGTGWTHNTATNSNAAIHAQGSASLTGTITLNSDVTIAVSKSAQLWLNGTLKGNNKTITKIGANTLWLKDSADSVSFVVKEGLLALSGTFNKGLPDGINSITVQNGAKLGFHSVGDTFDTALTFEGGSTLDLASGVSSNNNSQTYTLTGNVEIKQSTSNTQEVLLTAGKNRTLVLNGVVSGNARFAIRGDKPTTTLTLTLNNKYNTFTQGIEVGENRDNAIINLAAAGSAGTGNIELLNATALLNVAGEAEGYGQMTNAISGAGKVTITTGNLELSGQNTYKGGTTVGNGASLRLTHASAAGTGVIALSDAASELVYAGSETAEHGSLANAISGAGKLKVNSGKVALAAESSVGSATVVKGASLKLSGSAGLTVADAAHLSNKSTPAAATFSLDATSTVSDEATLENVAMAATTMAAASAGTRGVVSDAAISITAADAFSISGLDLLNSDLQVQSTSLSLSDVVLASGSTLMGQSADATTVLLEQVTLALSSNACTLADGSLYGEAYAGKTVGVYTVETFSNVSLSGNMLMSLPALAAIAAETSSNTAPDFYVFDFSGQDVNTEQLTLSANFGPEGSVVEGIQAGSSAYLFSAPAGGEAVPEPTTSALALLGLSGLALRRRRK